MSLGSIKICVGVTDLDWFEYLSARNPDESKFLAAGRSISIPGAAAG